MKEFLIVRHAKSSWEHPELRDIDRPLNNRGRKDAPFMASYLRKHNIHPTHLISSPARRAFNTAEFFYEVFGEKGAQLWKETDLYFGSEEDWLHLIQSLDEAIEFPAFFSHNPTLTYFINRFSNKWIENIPTCGVVHLQSSCENWGDVYFDNSIIKNIFFPKELNNK